MNKVFLILLLLAVQPVRLSAQCCAAGSGSPLAGEAATGVLQVHQAEVNANYQYVSSTKFLNGDAPERDFLDRYFSHYGYFRLGYGITENLTLSVEAGHYFNKTQIGLDKRDTITTKGWSDLIIFPRYDLINKNGVTSKFEVAVGLGLKIPLGNAKDMQDITEPFSGQVYQVIKPVAIRTTSGAHDFIFYGFVNRGFPLHNFRLYTNFVYIKKGWNKLGEKSGDYASLGLFASKTLFKHLGVTVQVKGEWIDKMKVNSDLALYGFFNYDPEATGSKKVMIVPQLSYSYKSFSVFVISEFPLYQYLNKQQIASQYFITSGLAYRFLLIKPQKADKANS